MMLRQRKKINLQYTIERPIIHYKFDQPNDTAVFNVSGNENSGQIQSETLWKDGCLQFDGSNYMVIPAPPKKDVKTTGFTVEVVVTIKSSPISESQIGTIAIGNYQEAIIGWGIYIDEEGKAWFYARNQKDYFAGVVSGESLPKDEFVHLTGIYDHHGKVQLYVNGQSQGINTGDDYEPWVFTDYAKVVESVLGNTNLTDNNRWVRIALKEFRFYVRTITGPEDEILNRGLQYSHWEGKDALTSFPLPPLLVRNKRGLRIMDRKLRYTREMVGQSPEARPLPITERAMMPAVPQLPNTIPSPYPWGGKENVYFSKSRAINGNTYKEPGKPWILQVGFLTPGIGDTVGGSHGYKTWYRISKNEGMTFSPLKPVIKKGKGYDLIHPIDGVWTDKNSFNVDATRPIVRASNGEIMVPLSCEPLDKDGKTYNPLSTYGYCDAGVLIGRWTEDGSDIVWDFGQWIRLEPEKSTRGICEPAIVELKREGEFIMIGRGSNDRHIFTYEGKWIGFRKTSIIPGYKWISYSRDFCRTWSEPVPFTYSDGSHFFSPSSCSTLIRSRYNGHLYWIGNLCSNNPDGNEPRYPLMIGEIDEKNLGLIKESILILDTRNPVYDSPKVQFSNFDVYEDPDTGNILVSLQRLDYAIRPWQSTYLYDKSWYLIGVPSKENIKRV